MMMNALAHARIVNPIARSRSVRGAEGGAAADAAEVGTGAGVVLTDPG
jgi:hypothetical protein